MKTCCGSSSSSSLVRNAPESRAGLCLSLPPRTAHPFIPRTSACFQSAARITVVSEKIKLWPSALLGESRQSEKGGAALTCELGSTMADWCCWLGVGPGHMSEGSHEPRHTHDFNQCTGSWEPKKKKEYCAT